VSTVGEESPPEDGVWPSWRRRLLADLLPARFAASQDGLVAPTYDPPAWLEGDGAITNEAAELARYLHEQQEKRADSAEARGGKVGQHGFALLAIAFTATGFEAARLRLIAAPGWVWVIALTPATLSILFFAVTTLQAAATEHRVRLSYPPILDDIAKCEPSEQKRLLVQQDDRAAFFATWSGTNRLDEVLQARAWLTRGIVALIVSGIVTVIL
jgi:hypothetical protein